MRSLIAIDPLIMHANEFQNGSSASHLPRDHEAANGQSVSMLSGRHHSSHFAQDLGNAIAAPPSKEFSTRKLKPASASKVPLHFEDEGFDNGVCGKKGTLGRCAACGLSMHDSCVAPLLPGQQPPCLRCSPSCKQGAPPPLEAVGPPPVSFRLGNPPTDAEAQAVGCKDAKEWHKRSLSRSIVFAMCAEVENKSLPPAPMPRRESWWEKSLASRRP